MTGAHSATLWWRKPRQLNGKILLFKIRMRWRYKNVKGTYRFITKKIPAKVTPRERRRLRRYMMDYRVLRLEPVREIQLTRIQPFAFISVHVSEGTGITENEVFWSPWSNNYTLQTLEGGTTVLMKMNANVIGTECLEIRCSFESTMSFCKVVAEIRVLK